ncbi:MAG: hypothetical protein AAF226_16430 [Verrucomicrobiota bacterium]
MVRQSLVVWSFALLSLSGSWSVSQAEESNIRLDPYKWVQYFEEAEQEIIDLKKRIAELKREIAQLEAKRLSLNTRAESSDEKAP